MSIQQFARKAVNSVVCAAGGNSVGMIVIGLVGYLSHGDSRGFCRGGSYRRNVPPHLGLTDDRSTLDDVDLSGQIDS